MDIIIIIIIIIIITIIIIIIIIILISSFFEIDFEIKTNAKKSRRFDLSEVIFK